MSIRHTEAAFEAVIETHLLANGYVMVYRKGNEESNRESAPALRPDP